MFSVRKINNRFRNRCISYGNIVVGDCKLNSKELFQVKLWIYKNRKALSQYWNSEGEMDTDDFFDSLKKLNDLEKEEE